MFLKKRIKSRIVIAVYVAALLLCEMVLLTSCIVKEETPSPVEETTETVTEETTVDFDSLPEEVKESMEYSPSKDFKKVTTRDKKDELCFVGDIILHKRPRATYDKDGIDGIVDNGFRILFDNSDFNIANLECAITDEPINPDDKEWTFALPSKYINVIKDSKINLLTLANNHILDFGEEALLNTIKVLDENGISHIGAGKNVKEADKVYIKEIEGKRYAFIAASAVIPKESWKASETRAGVSNGYDTLAVCTRVNKLKKYVDKVIVYMHWGGELEVRSRELQQLIGRRLIDAGADLVVGTHAHVVQEIEYYNNVPIVYSLGNFIYGGTQRDMILLKATFDYSKNEKGDLSIRVYPGVANYQKVSRYYKPEVLNDKIVEINRKNRNCVIDPAGNVTILEKVDESKIEHTVKPGIFETTESETTGNEVIEGAVSESETTSISMSEFASIALSLQTMDSSALESWIEAQNSYMQTLDPFMQTFTLPSDFGSSAMSEWAVTMDSSAHSSYVESMMDAMIQEAENRVVEPAS